jgi:selenide,water dikinase
MAVASRVAIEISASSVPLIAGARDLAMMGMIPAGSFANRGYCERSVTVAEGIEPVLIDLLADAQTSGGLLIAVAAERADALHAALEKRGVPHPEIGRVTSAGDGAIRLVP